MSGKNLSFDDESVFFLDSLFNNSPEAIVLLDNTNRVLKVNREFERLFDYKNEDIIGLHIDSLLSSKAEIEEASRFAHMAEAGEALNAESVRRRADGSPVEVSILGAPVEHDGRIIGIFGIYRDISERKKIERELAVSEVRYRELFENAPIGIFRTSSEGQFLQVNQTMADMFGCSSPEEVKEVYKDLAKDLYLRPEKRQEMLDALKEKGIVTNYEIEAKKKDGSILWQSVNARIASRLDDGSFLIDGFISDKTELKKAEQRLYESLEEKDVLLQEVHHRVKNNMQIISSLLNLETLKIEESKTRELLFVVQKRIQAMSLVHEKLYGSEDISEVELAAYTRDLASQVMDVFEDSKSPSLNFHLEELKAGIDFSIPYGLVVNELVMNAHKHAFAGVEDPQLMIKLYRGKKEITLVVRDNGVGLPSDYQNKIKHSLGLTLIDTLISQLQGKMFINSGNGTEWVIHFPAESVLPLHKRRRE